MGSPVNGCQRHVDTSRTAFAFHFTLAVIIVFIVSIVPCHPPKNIHHYIVSGLRQYHLHNGIKWDTQATLGDYAHRMDKTANTKHDDVLAFN